MPRNAATAEQIRSREHLDDVQLKQEVELDRRRDFRAPDEGMDGTTKAGPMGSPKATHRPSPARGEVQLKEAAGAVQRTADAATADAATADAAPAKPPPGPTESKGLASKSKGTTDGGMDAAPPPSAEAPPEPGPDKAPLPEPAGKVDLGSNAGSTGPSTSGKGNTPKATDSAAAQIGAAVFGAKPSAFIEGYKTVGAKLTTAKAKDEKKSSDAMPTFHAELPGDAQASGGGKMKGLSANTEITDGVEGADAPTPEGGNLQAAKSARQKVASGDASRASELADFTDMLKGFFGSMTGGIDTEADHVNTDPGNPPPIVLKGTSDPKRATRQDDDADAKITDANEELTAAIDAGKGPQDVHRVELKETFEPQELPGVELADEQISAGMAEYEGLQITAAERAGADERMDPGVQDKLDKADESLKATLEQQDADRAKAIAESEAQVDQLNADAAAEQEHMVADAKSDLAAEQAKTRKKQAKEVEKARRKGDKERRAAEGQIAKRQVDDQKKIESEYDSAEKKAEKEKVTAEKKADAEKTKAEKKQEEKSWWDSFKDAVSSVVDACCNLIGDIFDALGSLVGGILNAVKDLATGIIDAACSFAKGVLDVLATALKGLISGLIGSVFPGLADELNKYIDKGLDTLKSGIDAVGGALKKGVEAAVDTVNAVVQKGLSIVKTGMQTAIRVAGCIATGDFEGAFMQVFYAACDIAGLSKADAKALFRDSSDLIKDIIDHPGEFVMNLIKAGVGGFKKFASGFGGYLKDAFQEWIVGPLSGEGLQVPKVFNAMGIFKMVGSLMGVTFGWIKGLVQKKVGPGAMAVIDKVMEYVDAFMDDGIAGLWDQLKGDVGDLWGMLMGFVTDFIKSKVVTMAMEKIGSLLAGPIGALYQVLKTAWSIFQTVREKFDKLKGIVSGIFESIGAIARGSVGGAIGKIVTTLVSGMGVAIDLLARIVGVADIPKKIKKFLGGLRDKVQGAIMKLLDKVVGKIKGLFKGGKGRDNKGKDKGTDGPKLPKPTEFVTKDGHKHKVWTENKGGKLNTRVASDPKDVDDQIAEWKKDAKDAPADAKGAIGSAVGGVEAVDKKIDGKPSDKADEKKIAADQAKLAVALKKGFDAAAGADAGAGGPYPKTYAEYVAWAKKTYAADLKKLGGIGATFLKNGGEAKRLNQQLDSDLGALEAMKARYLEIRGDLDKGKEAAELKAKVAMGEAAEAHKGKTMPELLAEAKKIVKKIQEGGGAAKDLKGKLNKVMFASMELSKQIDPEGSEKGRLLYNEIDKKGNDGLLVTAGSAGASKAEQSKLAVNYRNWIREYFRTEVMGDEKAAGVLFLRDKGITGQKNGWTYEQVVENIVRKLKKPKDPTKEAVLRADFTLDTATPEELDKIYGAVVGSAQTTNASVNAGMTGSASGQKGDPKKLPKRGIKEGSESHTIAPEVTGGKVKIIKRSDPQDVMWLYKRGEAFQLAARIQRQTEVYIGTKEDKRVGVSGDPAILTRISANLVKLEKAMADARNETGDDADLIKDRKAFEKKLGGQAKKEGGAKSAIKYMLDWARKFMSAMAEPTIRAAEKIDMDLIEPTKDHPEYRKLIDKCGIPIDIGFAGAIGKKFEDVQNVFEGGASNIGVSVQALIAFQGVLADKLYEMERDEIVGIMKKVGTHAAAIKLAADRVDDTRARGEDGKSKAPAKASKKLTGSMAGNAPMDQARNSPKKGRVTNGQLTAYDMDAKTPQVPIELLTLDQLKFLVKRRDGIEVEESDNAASLVGKLKGSGVVASSGDNMDPRNRATVPIDDPDLALDEREKKTEGPYKDMAPFMAGILANLVDSEHDFIKGAKAVKMPMKAGISGNAHRFMNQASQMGAPLPGARMAVYSHLVTIEAHSFHEVMSASLPHVPYTPGKYIPFKPMDDEKVRGLAKSVLEDKSQYKKLLGEE